MAKRYGWNRSMKVTEDVFNDITKKMRIMAERKQRAI